MSSSNLTEAPEKQVQETPLQNPQAINAPDGGVAAWLVVLGAWCASFCTFGWLNSIGVFQEYYQNTLLLEYSPSTISWIPSLQIFLMMGLGPLVGIVYDHYGARWLLLIGSFLHIFGVMMTSLGTDYYQILLAQGLCSAIGVSAIFQPSVTCVAGWFTARRGLAFGLLFTGSSIGGIALPILVTHLIRTAGFPWAMRACAFLMLGLLIIANLTIRPFRAPQSHEINRAQLVKPFTEVPFLLVMAGFFFFTFGFFAPINFLPAQAVSAGMSPSLAQYLIPMLNAGSLFGRLGSGVAADKIGRYNVFIIVSYLSGLWVLALWLPSSPSLNASTIAFAVLFGFFSGGYVSLITPLVMAISPIEELGFRTGIVMFIMAVGGLITNPISGATLGSNGGWMGVKIFSGVFALAGSTFVLAARVRQTGLKVFVKY